MEGIIVALIGGAVTIFNILYTNHAQKKRLKAADQQHFKDGLQCLLRAEIIRANEKYTTRGYCPVYAKESLRRVYSAYHNLGGNDIATGMYKACLNLPDQPRKENDSENRLETQTHQP